MKITHVVNPFSAPPASMPARAMAVANLSVANALDFTRRVAPAVEVEVVAVFAVGDEQSVPPFATSRQPLPRTLLDVIDAEPRRKLPLIADIVRLGAEMGSGDLLVYSNSDVGVQPHFYSAVARLAQHTPSFGINRRNIDPSMLDVGDLPLMCSQTGTGAGGTDTFVFPRTHAFDFDLGTIAIALPMIEYALLANMDAHSGFRARLFKDLHLTFHHGQEQVWCKQWALRHHNEGQAKQVCQRLSARFPQFPAGGLFDSMQSRTLAARPKTKSLRFKLLRAIGLRAKHVVRGSQTAPRRTSR